MKSSWISATIDVLSRNRLPIVRGAEATECGLACITMVARYYGHDVDLNGMRRRFSLSMSGATLRSMMTMADSIGLTTRALRVEVATLRQLRTPAILHWNLDHFVVLASARGRRYIVHDPASGRRKLSHRDVSSCFSGVVLELAPEGDRKRTRARQKVRLRDLWSRIDGFWRAIAQILLLSILLQIAVFSAPFYLQLTVDEGIQAGDMDLLTVLALGFGALMIVQIGVGTARSLAIAFVAFLLSYQMTGNTVRHLVRLRTEFFEKRHIGDILSRIGSIAPIREVLTRGLVATVIDGLMAIVAAAILFIYSSVLALVVVISILISLGITYSFYPMQRLRTEEQIVAAAREQSNLIETIRGSTVVKMMGGELDREATWRNLMASATNAAYSVSKLSIWMNSAQGWVTGMQTIVVVYLGARMIVNGDGLTVGMLFAFLSYRQTFSTRCIALINQLVEFSYLKLHLERIGDIVQAPRDVAQSDNLVAVDVRGQIRLEGISFRYGASDRLVLTDVTLDVSPGSLVVITGASGGGKTTLLKIVLGLYAPVSGEIYLDGARASPSIWRSWRRCVGVVAQDDRLFAGTVADNVAFFEPRVDMKRVEAACVGARVHDEVLAMPMQYRSLVGDMGSALSAGQRQRIMLARALYREPKILVLDEGTANLDAKTEHEVVELVASLSITRVVVAHRSALIESADVVYKVQDGKVAELLE